jgi:high-affinity Fe2+/Pb2+ permease
VEALMVVFTTLIENNPPGKATLFMGTIKGMILVVFVSLVIALYGRTINPLDG